MNKKWLGFTLIEALIVVAIIGIIAAFAFPSYVEYVRKSNRAEAKAELMEVAQRLQRCYTNLGRFDDATNCAVFAQVTAKFVTRKGLYEISFDATAPTRTTYKLHATALKKPQTLDTKNGCNDLTLDQNGTMLPALCW